MLQLQTQQLMTSQIRSRTEYLIQTHNILIFILYLKLRRNVAARTAFNTMMIVTFLSYPVSVLCAHVSFFKLRYVRLFFFSFLFLCLGVCMPDLNKR